MIAACPVLIVAAYSSHMNENHVRSFEIDFGPWQSILLQLGHACLLNEIPLSHLSKTLKNIVNIYANISAVVKMLPFFVFDRCNSEKIVYRIQQSVFRFVLNQTLYLRRSNRIIFFCQHSRYYQQLLTHSKSLT